MKNKRVQALFIVAFVTAIVYAALHSVIQDYLAFAHIWEIILEGGDPWLATPITNKYGVNAYGPVFNLFAVPYYFNEKLPRIIWVLFWFGAGWFLICRSFGSRELTDRRKFILSALVILSPLLWIQTVYYGQFDVVVAALSLFAIDAKLRNKSIIAGCLICVAAALKYYPLALVPFIFLRRRKPDYKFLASFCILGFAIYGTTYLIWGGSFRLALETASYRYSKLLSIFQFLRGEYSPLKLFGGVDNLDRFSVPLLALAGAGVFLHYFIRKMDLVTGSILAMTATFALYKVGHPQFHILVYFLLIYWIIGRSVLPRNATIAVIIYIGFMNLFVVTAVLTNGFAGRWGFIRQICGLPAFIIFTYLFLMVLSAWQTPETGTD